MFKNISLEEIYNQDEAFSNLLYGTGIVLIGRATNGPVMVPVGVETEEEAVKIFGAESELTNAFIEARAAGGSLIYLLRVNGSHAETNLQDQLTLVSTSADDSSNDLMYQISTHEENRFLQFLNPLTGYTASYIITGKTIDQIATEINIQAMALDAPFWVSKSKVGDSSVLVDELFSKAQTSGGSTDLRFNGYAEQVREALDILAPYPIAQIGILGEAFNEKLFDMYLYQKIAEFADEKARASIPCIITIGASALHKNIGMLYTIADSFQTLLATECRVSEYINVVIAFPRPPGPLEPLESQYYESNGVAAYCGLIDSLGAYEGTTNKPIAGMNMLVDGSGLNDLEKIELSSMGYVVFKEGTFSGVEQLRVLKGVNLAKATLRVVDTRNSFITLRYIAPLMSNISNVKTIQSLLYKLGRVAESEEITELTTLKGKVEAVLEAESGYIKDYKVSESYSYEGFTRSIILNIEIVPIGEIESISLSVQAR